MCSLVFMFVMRNQPQYSKLLMNKNTNVSCECLSAHMDSDRSLCRSTHTFLFYTFATILLC